jgi:hypothetical protein
MIATRHHDGGFWPTRHQELALRAALLKGNEAIDAWRDWRASVDIDKLDPGSYRLLPLVYQNLRAHGVKDTLMSRLKGIYRLTWYENQMSFHNMAALLRSFHQAGIQTMILKGAALTLLHYRDYGLRPMGDFDVLVRTEQASAAIALLTKLGWRPKQGSSAALNEECFSVRHGNGFEDAAGRQFDLHWHLLIECCYPHADDDYWDGAVPIELHDVSTCALNPTDQLLHVCVHGARWNRVPPLRWLADAMTVIGASQSEIDWDRLMAQAQKRRLVLPLKDTLIYLRDVLGAPIPKSVLQSIQAMPISRQEHIEYKIQARRAKLWGRLSLHWFHHLRQTRHLGPLQRLAGFPVFLQHTWGVNRLWQLPYHAVLKGMQEVWAVTARRRNQAAKALSRKG